MSTSFSKKINVTDQVDTTVSVYNDKVYAHLQTTKGGKWKSISLTAPEFHKLVKTIPKIAKLIQKAGQKLKTKKGKGKKDKKKLSKKGKNAVKTLSVTSADESSSDGESGMEEASSNDEEQ